VVPDRAALSSLLAPIRPRLVLAISCQALSALAGVVPFIAVAELGRLLLDGGHDRAARAWTVVVIAAAALFVRLILLLGAGGITHLADNDLQLSIRRRLVAKLGRVPLGWLSSRTSGTVKKTVQDDVGSLHHLVAHSLLETTSAVVIPITSMAYLCWVDWRMTLVTLVPLAAGFTVYGRSMAGMGEQLGAFDQAMERINGSAVEFVQGIAVVKTFGQTRRAHRRFAEAADDFAAFFLSWVGSTIRSKALSEVLLSPVVVLLVVLTGGTVMVTGGWIAPVDILPFALLGVGFTAPVLSLSYASYDLRTARAAAERVNDGLDAAELPISAEPTAPSGNRVVFDGVRFSYDGRNDVLDGVDLVLEEGTVTALVGPSGSGKSTLASLIPRFFDVTGGAISVGGADLRDLAIDELYQRVAFVFQDVQLLRDTVAANIALARPGAHQAEIEAAARGAYIHDAILELRRGYDSVIGEDARLSGGQAQRLSIARALLADSPIVVLDEASVFADPQSEAAVQDALSELTRGKTLLVIAHRLSTVVGADQIAVMEGGKVSELGTHPELIAANGTYSRMWQAHERTTRWRPHASVLSVSRAGEEAR
jgi:ATP-binding cassette subfamily B protein IrtA